MIDNYKQNVTSWFNIHNLQNISSNLDFQPASPCPNTTLFFWSTEKCKCHFEVFLQSAALYLTPFYLTVSVRCPKTHKTFYSSLRENMHWLNRLQTVCGRHSVEVWSTLWNKTLYSINRTWLIQWHMSCFVLPSRKQGLSRETRTGCRSLCVVGWGNGV
jgi:hypothetical protein